MPLYKLQDFYPNYKEAFHGDDVKALDLYTEGGEKIGSVDRVLVDEEGRFRYLVVSTGFLGFGKKILLPIGLSRIDYNAGRVFVDGLSKEQAEQLPEYQEKMSLTPEQENKIRIIYQGKAGNATSTNESDFNRQSYSYQQEPSMYEMTQQRHGDFSIYEERLIASRR
ncbi:PRC-barrel domain-containing protein [Aerosakkonemataceae cyanobacterium BLCC-F154]|uniref:PRC-barrel domain-containing protein n=1 Tax=Floridaenema fluviatile BLCC-F154 TaxID=3153640 RepID=A0ABV4Y889_9CYAN